MGSRLARRMERRLGLDNGWMDIQHHEDDVYITARSPEELARKLKEMGQEQVMTIIRLLASND